MSFTLGLEDILILLLVIIAVVFVFYLFGCYDFFIDIDEEEEERNIMKKYLDDKWRTFREEEKKYGYYKDDRKQNKNKKSEDSCSHLKENENPNLHACEYCNPFTADRKSKE